MVQQGQTFELTRRGSRGERLWAYRYRTGGRDSTRVQRGGFASEHDAQEALGRELERLRRERRISRRVTLSELVETYLAQHGDDRKAPVPAQQGDDRVRRPKGWRADLGRDRRMADDDLTRLPLRSNTGAAAGTPPRRRL